MFRIRKNYISAIFATAFILPSVNLASAQTNFFQEISPQEKIGGEEVAKTSTSRATPSASEGRPAASSGILLDAAGKEKNRNSTISKVEKLGVDDRGAKMDFHESPSQFQIYIKQSTGKNLPIYGQSLFARPQAYQVDAAAPTPGDYVLGPGDEVNVQVWGGVNYDGALTVDRNGQVNIPRVGVVNLAGVKASGVSAAIRSKLRKPIPILS